MKRVAWKAALGLCAALYIALGGIALADTAITDEAGLRTFLSSAGTDTGIIGAGTTVSIAGATLTTNGAKTLTGGGAIVRGSGNTGVLITVVRGASLTLNSVTLDGGGSAVTGVTGSLIDNDGTLTLNDGATLKNNLLKRPRNGGGVTNTYQFIMNGGTICDNYAETGGGVYSFSGAQNTDTAIIRGGTITRNKAESGGGGIYSHTSLTMEAGGAPGAATSGTISNNTAYTGGGVVSNRSFTLSAGTISGNTAQHSGGIYNSNVAAFTMTGGSVANNTAQYNYGGVSNTLNGTFAMTGGSITGNRAIGGNGGGVSMEGSSFSLGGGAVISGNMQGAAGADVPQNVYLPSGKTITVTAAFTGGASVGVSVQMPPTDMAPLTIAQTTDALAALAAVPYFHSDNAAYQPKQISNSTRAISLLCPLRITDQPDDATVERGDPATFRLTLAAGITPYQYQWQRKAAGSAAFADIFGANASSYQVSAVDVRMHGDQYRCLVSDAALPLEVFPSDEATLLVKPVLTFDVHPAADTWAATGYIAGGLTAAASVSPSGTAVLNWYACDGSGTVSGPAVATGGAFTLPATLSAGTYYYLCQASFPGASVVASHIARVTVLALPPQPNSVTGVLPGQEYRPGTTVTFTAHGGGMDNASPQAGHTRWRPFHWETNPSGDFSGGFTQSFSTAGMSAGAHTLTVSFALERYTGSAWTELVPRAVSEISVPFAIAPVPGSGDTATPPQTGDGSPLWLWAALCLAAGAGLLALRLWRRRK